MDLKTHVMADKSDFEEKTNSRADNKIPNISGHAKNTDYNAKTTEIEGKIPSI